MNLIQLPICHSCKGYRWVCESHTDKHFEHDDCNGAGQPCSECNNGEVIEDLRGFTITKELEHTPSEDCWCEPELVGDYESEGGVKHYLHREIQ